MIDKYIDISDVHIKYIKIICNICTKPYIKEIDILTFFEKINILFNEITDKSIKNYLVSIYDLFVNINFEKICNIYIKINKKI